MIKALAIKDWILAIGALAGMSAGLYSVIAKPIQDEGRINTLETKIAYIEPKVHQGEINVAVVSSRLDKIEQGQDKILNIVLDIKRKI